MDPPLGDHLVADLGNRFLKIGVFTAGRILEREVLPADDALAGRPWTFPSSCGRAAYASVNPAREAALESWIRRGLGHGPQKLGRDLEIPLVNTCLGVGADRLVNALAALRRFPGGAIAVDIGTAVTVDLVSPDAEFLGGAILPGPHLGARALARYAAQLPAADPTAPDRAVGRATGEAIRSGLHHGVIGSVRELVRAFSLEAAFPPTVVVTGGDAAGYLAAFPEAHHVPNLTLEGIGACL